MGSNENEPAKILLPFLQRADELQKHEPLVAYYCRLYAMERGLKIAPKERTKTTSALLVSLINQLEKDKKNLTLGPEDNLYIEGFALNVFAKADKQDRAGKADVNTAKTFYAASIFFEILNQLGELPPEIEQKQKYAVWKAADIRKAIKEGRKPEPGPPKEEENLSTQVEAPHPDIPQVNKTQDFMKPSSPGKTEQTFSSQFSSAQHYTPNRDTQTSSTPDYQTRQPHSYVPDYQIGQPQGSAPDYRTGMSQSATQEYQTRPVYSAGLQSQQNVPDHTMGDPNAYTSSYSNMPQHSNDSHYIQPGSSYGYPSTEPSHDSYVTQPYGSGYGSYPNLHDGIADSKVVNQATYPSNSLFYQHANGNDAGIAYHSSAPMNPESKPDTNYAAVSGRDGTYAQASTVQYSYNSNYEPPADKIAEAHKAARFAVGALAFDDVPTAVDYLKRSLELLTNPSAQ